MDPNAALGVIRDLCEKIQNGTATNSAPEELTDVFAALDEWLSKGGFLPMAWQR